MTNTARPARYRADRRAPQHGLTTVVGILIALALVGLIAVGLGHLFADAMATINDSIANQSGATR